MVEVIITKKCTKCKQFKPLDEFWANSRTVDKKFYWCKSCASEHEKSIEKNNKRIMNKPTRIIGVEQFSIK